MSSRTRSDAKPNRLLKEKSPYLLQHAFNPVDWYPWGKEAFEKAREENKPIFLSIGYSSCHWCHVMERESFENEEIARIMNEDFVSIKVDREERPDLDDIYMKAVMSITGSGGWPLSVFLTPRLEPFYGGTYFPPVSRQGLPGFPLVLKSIAESWKSERGKIVQSAGQLTSSLKEMYSTKRLQGKEIQESVFDDCFRELSAEYDPEYGGFGVSPKFPMPSNILFLFRYYDRDRKSNAALQMGIKTLNAMAKGGIYDQIGGGFHRYSTDRYWLVPHFEKMLYDNALLIQAYSEAFLITKDQSYSSIVRETMSWVMREMTEMREGPSGYYSAQDADSAEGEGFYYVWSREEIEEAVGSNEAEIVSDYFSVTREGNFEKGKSILTASKSVSSTARQFQLDEETVTEIVERSKKIMLSKRSNRPKPSVDDKILSGWNGLMISAASKAYQAIQNPDYLESARSAANFVLSHLSKKEDENDNIRLYRMYRDGLAKGEGVLEDYSFLINGLIDLYESCFETTYLYAAISLCKTMVADFYDSKNSCFFFTYKSEDLIARPKDSYDGAIPSGNSTALLACLRIYKFTGEDSLREKCAETVKALSSSVEARPSSFTYLLVALDFLQRSKEIVISGDNGNEVTALFLKTLRSRFLPNSIVALAVESIQKDVPVTQDRFLKTGESPKAYVCSNFACRLPASTPEELDNELGA